MKTDKDNMQKSIVIECYRYNVHHDVVIAIHNDDPLSIFYYYVPKYPSITFGDTLLYDSAEDKHYVSHGNPHLIYRMRPKPFPNCLLWELITERPNNGD